MKRILMIVVGCVVAGCVGKNHVPVPDQRMSEGSGYPLAKLQRGHEVYTSQCGRCHELKMPSNISSADWHIVVPGMAWNASISADDEDAVLKYILAAR